MIDLSPAVHYLAAAPTINGTSLVNAFSSLQTTLTEFVVPSAGLAAVYGGLIHAHIFHTPQAKDTGKEILKYAVIAIIIVGVGPSLLQGLAGALGVPA